MPGALGIGVSTRVPTDPRAELGVRSGLHGIAVVALAAAALGAAGLMLALVASLLASGGP